MVAVGAKRILLAEDDPALCELLRAALEREAYAVEMCSDTLSSLARIASIRPSLVVIDSELPSAGGIAIIEHLRRKGRLVPFILLSAKHDERLRKLSQEWPLVQYLSKPFSIQELLLAVARAGQ